MSAERTSSEQRVFTESARWFTAFLANTDQKRVQELQTLLTLQIKFPHLRERMLDAHYDFGVLFAGGGTGQSEAALAFDILQGRRTDDIIEMRPPQNRLVFFIMIPLLKCMWSLVKSLENLVFKIMFGVIQ